MILAFASLLASCGNHAKVWNGKRCAVVLTYDDAIEPDISHVLPALDSFGLKGTFYVIGSSPYFSRHLKKWRTVAKEGHELGNHTLFHDCDGKRPNHGHVKPDHDLAEYSVKREVNEIIGMNTILQAVDGKHLRTFAFPCGDRSIGNIYFYDSLKNDFAGARGTDGKLVTLNQVNLSNINAFVIQDRPASYLIDLVKKAMDTNSLLVFVFHSVGGSGEMNEDAGSHTALLKFLKEHEDEIWVAPMVDVAQYIRMHQNGQQTNDPPAQ